MLSNSVHFVRDYLFTLPVLAKFALGMVMLVSFRLCPAGCIFPRSQRTDAICQQAT